MRTFIIVCISLLLLVMGMAAQDKKPETWDAKAEVKYKKRLSDVKEEIWSWNKPGFKNRTVPAEYANESAVILAKHHELTTPDKDRELHQTTRQLVRINDKAALEEYSEFAFNQYELLSRGTWYVLDPFGKNTSTTYVGVKVYKQDGSVKEIYSDEAVVTDVNRWKHKARKLAIPGLQVGDFIDYFIRTERDINHATAYTEEVFVLGDEQPILEYSIHVGAWEEVFVLEYRSMNGAPNFKEKNRQPHDGAGYAGAQRTAPACAALDEPVPPDTPGSPAPAHRRPAGRAGQAQGRHHLQQPQRPENPRRERG